MLTPDVIVPDPAEPQSYNRYSYVNNRPLTFNDPTGHCAETGDEACWSLAEQIWRVHRHIDEKRLSLTFLGTQSYLSLNLLNSILDANLQDSYIETSENLPYIETVLTMIANTDSLFKPLQIPADAPLEMQAKFSFLFSSMAQVYEENGIDLTRIKNENNPLLQGDFPESGMVEVLRLSLQNFEHGALLEELGLDNSHYTNYEPNYFSQLVVKNSFATLAVRQDLIINAIPLFPGDVLQKMFTSDIFSTDVY